MILVSLPIRTVSAMNTREHHMVRYRRVKAERDAVALALRPKVGKGFAKKHPRLVVTLTRIGIRQPLDGDNLQASFKAVRDAVAEVIGIDDGSDRIEWRYAQRRGAAWGVEIAVGTPEEMAA
jgi:hypothetical protein